MLQSVSQQWPHETDQEWSEEWQKAGCQDGAFPPEPVTSACPLTSIGFLIHLHFSHLNSEAPGEKHFEDHAVYVGTEIQTGFRYKYYTYYITVYLYLTVVQGQQDSIIP